MENAKREKTLEMGLYEWLSLRAQDIAKKAKSFASSFEESREEISELLSEGGSEE